MPLTFRPTQTGYQLASYNQLIPTPITNFVAVSNAAGQITLTWSGGVGQNAQYSYALSTGTMVFTVGSNPTTLQLSSTNSITTTVTLTVTLLGGTTTATATVTTKSPGVQAFNTINSTGSTTAAVTLSMPSGYTSGTSCGIAVDFAQAKMLFAFSGNAYYSTSSDSGTTWTAFTTINLDTSSTNRHACGLRNDGQYGYVVTAQKTYTVNWTGAVPTFTSFDTTVAPLCRTAGYFAATMTPDGLTLILTPYQGTIYYTRFSGSAFAAFTSTSLTTSRMGVAISPDSSTLFVSNSTDQYTTITWNNNVGTFAALANSNSTSGHVDDRAYIFIGGDYTGASPPKYILGGSGILQYLTWNQATKTASTTATSLVSSITPDSTNSYSASGTQGNIIYYVNASSIYKLTISVT